MSPILLVLCTVLGCGVGDTHGPCEDKACPDDKDCKVKYVPCLKPPCPAPYSQCVNKDKPGSCPPDTIKHGKCMNTCNTDAGCPRDWKCCGHCPRECKPPSKETVKTGRCPPIAQCPKSLPYCPITAQCKTDGDCVGPKKCCGKCPRLCIEPESHD